MDPHDLTIDPFPEPTAEECAAVEADVAAGLVYPDCGCGLTRERMREAIDGPKCEHGNPSGFCLDCFRLCRP